MDVIGEIEEIEINEGDQFVEDNDIHEDDTPELQLFPFPHHQIKIESLLVEDMIEKCAFIDSLIGEYNPPFLECPFCHQLVDYTTMKCPKNHLVELCMKTFQPLIDARKQLSCHTCKISAIDLSESDAFQWIYRDNKCAISGHKIHKIKFS